MEGDTYRHIQPTTPAEEEEHLQKALRLSMSEQRKSRDKADRKDTMEHCQKEKKNKQRLEEIPAANVKVAEIQKDIVKMQVEDNEKERKCNVLMHAMTLRDKKEARLEKKIRCGMLLDAQQKESQQQLLTQGFIGLVGAGIGAWIGGPRGAASGFTGSLTAMNALGSTPAPLPILEAREKESDSDAESDSD